MNRRSPTILCVDDEQTIQSLLEFMLVPAGFKVVIACNGRQALEVLAGQPVDLVLSDVVMPEMDGFELCTTIKAKERLRNIPVVMLTGAKDKRDRIRGIEAGAEDFITKPFDRDEVLARIRMLLRVKELDDKLNYAYRHIARLTSYGEQMFNGFDPSTFVFMEKIDMMVDQIMRKLSSLDDSPEVVVVGVKEDDICRWYRYDMRAERVSRSDMLMNLHQKVAFTRSAFPEMSFYNEYDESSNVSDFVAELEKYLMPISNMVRYASDSFCIIAVNYERNVTSHYAEVLNHVVMQSLFLKSLAAQIKDTQSAFDYMVFALARASEANDEDTGAHVMRVGDFCAELAIRMDLDDGFVNMLRIQAALHDVGKIHVPSSILKKPGELSSEEWKLIQQHTIYGPMIIGGHSRMQMAASIAVSHHEHWDGSGYPYGLRGEQIPLEARIVCIADQYDALRNARAYKKAYDHATAVDIITRGDGRTLPWHFDPRVLKAFVEVADRLDEIYRVSVAAEQTF